uniref:VWFA domain-containing protein n=1 Tax=Arcella intermedia TaxID=1963864 RepID=A0A6B2KX07_9EUKA
MYNKVDDTNIPLKSIDVRAKLINYVADVEVIQNYTNTSAGAIEAIFKFEHFNSSLTNFEVTVNGKNLKGICKEKNEALDDYDDALATGKGAFMVENDKKDGVFRVSIGNLEAGAECVLSMRYVMELDLEDQFLKFVLPITRTRLQTNTNSGISIALDILMPRNITELKSLSHEIADQYRIDGTKATLSFKSKQLEGREFELLIKIENPNDPVHYIEVFSTQKTMEALEKDIPQKESDPELEKFGPQPGHSFFSIPDFPQRSSAFIGFDDPLPPPEQELPKQITEPTIPHAAVISLYPSIQTDDDILSEIIFIVDRSGSMAGSRLNQAKNALQLFLRSLPQNSLFNIVSFGSTFNTLFPKSTKLTEASLATATHYVAQMEANMAGTNILEPIKSVLNQFKQMKDQDPGSYQQYPKQVFCLTDGEVDNTQEVLKFVKNNIDEARIFTFGIGSEASKTLVRGIAKYGRGKEEFVVSGERIEPKVMKQLKRALMPILKNITIDWSGLDHPKYSNLTTNFPPVFDGERILIYGFLSGIKNFNDQKVTITGTTGQQTHTWEIPITKKDLIEGSLVHRLTARQYIQALELTKSNKDKIVELGIEWGLVTKYTSYIAIEERETATISHLQKINVQKEITNARARASDRPMSRMEYHSASQNSADLAEYDDFDAEEYHSIIPTRGFNSFSAALSPRNKSVRQEEAEYQMLRYNREEGMSKREESYQINCIRRVDRVEPPLQDMEAWSEDEEDVLADESPSSLNISREPFLPSPVSFAEEATAIVPAEPLLPPPPVATGVSTPPPVVPGGSPPAKPSAEQSPMASGGLPPPKPSEGSLSPPKPPASAEQLPEASGGSPPSPTARGRSPPKAREGPPPSMAREGPPPPKPSTGPLPMSSLIEAPTRTIQPKSSKIESRSAVPKQTTAMRPTLKKSKEKEEMKYESKSSQMKEEEAPQANFLYDVGDLFESAPKPIPTYSPLENIHGRPLDNFILQQKVDGSFTLNPIFLKHAKMSKTTAEVLDLMPKELLSVEESKRVALWVTAVALRVFERVFDDLKDEWMMIYEKGMKFINVTIKEVQKHHPNYTSLNLLQNAENCF